MATVAVEAAQLHHVAVFEHSEFVYPVSYRGYVAGRKVTVTCVRYEQWGSLSGDHNPACSLLQNRYRPGAFEWRERGLYRIQEIAGDVQLIFDQMAQHLAVNSGREVMARYC
jgi:hypothetical protein